MLNQPFEVKRSRGTNVGHVEQRKFKFGGFV